MSYEYRCRVCRETFFSDVHGLDTDDAATHCNVPIARVYSFAFHRPMQPHFNVGVGRPISNRQQLDDELKRKSEEAFNRTGIPASYKQADLRDRDIFPVTDAGLKETYDRHDVSSPVRSAIKTVTD